MGFIQQGNWLDEPPRAANFSDYERPSGRPGGCQVGPVDALELLRGGASDSVAGLAIDFRLRQREGARQALRVHPTKIFDADRGMPDLLDGSGLLHVDLPVPKIMHWVRDGVIERP